MFKTVQVISNGQVKIGSAAQMAVSGAEQAPIADDNGREGWLFKKTAGDTAKFNYFFYGQGNASLRLNEIRNIFFNGSIDTYTNGSSTPFIVLYTKPQASGNAGAWYHSKIAYTLPDTTRFQLGEMSTFHTAGRPTEFYGLKHIALSNKIIEGDALGSEEILYLSVHSDSASATGTQILISDVGFETIRKDEHKIHRKIKLIS